jgi:hypothetical protein
MADRAPYDAVFIRVVYTLRARRGPSHMEAEGRRRAPAGDNGSPLRAVVLRAARP